MNVRKNAAGEALASITTLLWNIPSKAWTGGAAMADASLNKRMTAGLGPGVAFAQMGIIGFDGQIKFGAPRRQGLPEDASAMRYGCPGCRRGRGRRRWRWTLGSSWDLPSLGPGATAIVDVTVPGARRCDFADASLDTSSIGFVLDCRVWNNNGVRVTARNVSGSTVDLAAAPLKVRVTKRRNP